MEEDWKDIKGYEGLYQISNLGRVKSFPKLNGKWISEEKILKNKVNKKGYHQVCLCKDKNSRQYPYVHRLVAEAFIENPLNLSEVNHMDGNKGNNNLNNLEWTNHKNNIIHGWVSGLMENVREAPGIHFGYKCFLIRIDNDEKIKFESRKELSRFLGYDEAWLSNSIKQGSDYKLACKKKGYLIELEVSK